MKLYVSSATGNIYDENTLRESFFMMRNAAPREYDCSSDEYYSQESGGQARVV